MGTGMTPRHPDGTFKVAISVTNLSEKKNVLFMCGALMTCSTTCSTCFQDEFVTLLGMSRRVFPTRP